MPLPTIHRWIFGLLLLALAGCTTPEEEDPVIIVTLDPEFTVDLFEQRDSTDGTPVFGLWIESKKTYPCGNYPVEADVRTMPGEIDVLLKETTAPSPCLGDPAPARSFIPVGNLADGTYRFRLSLSPVVVSEGWLTVQNGHYELSLSQEQGIDFQNRVLESLPGEFVWGYALTPEESDKPVADQFSQSLKPLTAEANLAPGFYGYFTVSGAGKYFFHRSIAPAVAYAPYLRRLNSASLDAVRNLVQSYRDNPGQPLSIHCWTTQGKL